MVLVSEKRRPRSPPLQGRAASNPRAGMQSESIASGSHTVIERAASLRRLRRGAAGAPACDRDWRRTVTYRGGRQGADVLRIRAPIKGLIAELRSEEHT